MNLNKAMIIGNLTRDPELRYTPQGVAVCTIGLATNRAWTSDDGVKHEEAEFHRLVAWNKLAELCAQLLFKGRKIYIEGRLQTRQWAGQDGVQRKTTEIVINNMILLDSRQAAEAMRGADVDQKSKEEPAKEVVAPEIKKVSVGGSAPKTTADDVVGKVPADLAVAKAGDDQGDDSKKKPKKEKADEVAVKADKKKEDNSDTKEVKGEDIPF